MLDGRHLLRVLLFARRFFGRLNTLPSRTSILLRIFRHPSTHHLFMCHILLPAPQRIGASSFISPNFSSASFSSTHQNNEIYNNTSFLANFMNLVLETFERVLYPSGGSASRRASTSGMPGSGAHYHSQQSVSNRQQQTAITRRKSSAMNASGSTATTKALLSTSNSMVFSTTPHTALRTSSSERRSADQMEATAASGTRGQTTAECRSRSSTGVRRKKSSAATRKPSFSSLLFSALSSASSSQRRPRASRQAPPRQWSVPERTDNADSEEESFRLVRKAPSALPSPSPGSSRQRTPPRKQLSGEEIDLDECSSGLRQSVLFGFVSAEQCSHGSFRLGRLYNPHHAHFCPAADSSWLLAQCARSALRPSLCRSLFLRCIDPEPMFPFLHYAVLDGSGAETGKLADELNCTGLGEFGSFEEVFALQRQSAVHSPSPGSPSRSFPSSPSSHSHQGFIVLCFCLLEDQQPFESLESSWLSWTGASEIYKYSPRAWSLRRLSLHRRISSPPVGAESAGVPPSPASFAYVLLCEFGTILHPANALAALDMCERLRARKCGLVALYQVRHSHYPSGASTFPSCSSLSPHWSPQLRRGASQLQRGHSQDVPDSGSSQRRRTMLLKLRERSLGWESSVRGTDL